VFAKVYLLKTSATDVLTDLTQNITLEFADATQDILYMELNVFLMSTTEETCHLTALLPLSSTLNKENVYHALMAA